MFTSPGVKQKKPESRRGFGASGQRRGYSPFPPAPLLALTKKHRFLTSSLLLPCTSAPLLSSVCWLSTNYG